jgi:class I fructose-bisphosphate aldolase
MGLAKTTRLNRIFSNPDGRLFSLAIDHFAGMVMPDGLKNLPATITELMKGKPDAVTMLKGMARGTWEPYAGRTPLILQTIIFPGDDQPLKKSTSVEEALFLGADAVAISLNVKCDSEADHLELLAETVDEAAEYDMPVISHIYPRNYTYDDQPDVMIDHDSILWAVRCGVEYGADVVKVPFTGDPDGFREIVASSPVPVVCAGGPKTESFEDALNMMRKIVASGAQGAVVGRNIWGSEDPLGTLRAFKEIVHPEG